LWVGRPAIQAILGTLVVPGWLDRFLARNGYESQLSRELADPREPGNLFAPVPGDFGAHGRFDNQSSHGSVVASGGTVRKMIAATAVAASAGLLAVALGRRNGR
jgi:hypothetical protein